MHEGSSASDYDNTPQGRAARWKLELQKSREEIEQFHKQGDKVIDRFRDERSDVVKGKRVALFTSNMQLLRCLLYGRTPSVSVQRRFKDANDDAARVAGVMAERLLNADICSDSDTFAEALGYALEDRLLPGLGSCITRYEAKVAKLPDGTEDLQDEYAQVDYVHWKDQLWSAGSRVFSERRWWGFKKCMSKMAFLRRFPKADWSQVPKKASGKDKDGKPLPWDVAEVWELHSKEFNTVDWYVDGMDYVLDSAVPDAEKGLVAFDGFWPGARPMAANLTTSSEVPRADFILVQDSYNEVDMAQTRASELMDNIRVHGWYDKRMQKDISAAAMSGNGQLTPVENFAGLSERGGMRSLIEFWPTEVYAQALQHTMAYKAEQEAECDRVTGIADIMRGAASTPNSTATEQGIKAGFGSVRVQALQDEFARFATDLQKLKMEVIAKRFSPQTIIRRSNILQTEDGKNPQVVMEAVKLLKSRYWEYQIEVKPESVNLTDLASLRSEKQETLAALGQYLQIAGPIAQQLPGAAEDLISLMKWTLSGTRGASTAEAIIDRMAEKAKQAASQPQQAQPDPKMMAEQAKLAVVQAKGQQDLQKSQMEHRQRLMELQAEVDADAQREQNQAQWNVREAAAKQALSPPKLEKPSGRPGA